ncbi:MAG: DinB family protein [Candidatus Kariarchaeaceae archaeon]|jgi:uncharacterized damage-inducible protein DinB
MDIIDLFEYQTWADERVFYHLEHIEEAEREKVFEGYTSIKQRMNHIVMALEVWYERVNGSSPQKLPNYMDESTDEIKRRWQELNTKLSVFFSTPRKSSFVYKNSAGSVFTNNFEDVAYHIINHTTQYRSQIIMMIRMLGYEMDDTDYILWKRTVDAF